MDENNFKLIKEKILELNDLQNNDFNIKFSEFLLTYNHFDDIYNVNYKYYIDYIIDKYRINNYLKNLLNNIFLNNDKLLPLYTTIFSYDTIEDEFYNILIHYYTNNNFYEYLKSVYIENNKYLNFYMYKGDRIINIAIRNNIITPITYEVIENINQLLDTSNSFDKEITLYRGINGNYVEKLLKMQINDEIIFEGFNSMTTELDIFQNFSMNGIVLKLNFAKNSKFIHFNLDEFEILTYPNIICKIKDKYVFNLYYFIIEVDVLGYTTIPNNIINHFDVKFIDILKFISKIPNQNLFALIEIINTWPILYLRCLINYHIFKEMLIEPIKVENDNAIEYLNKEIHKIFNSISANYEKLIYNFYANNLLTYNNRLYLKNISYGEYDNYLKGILNKYPKLYKIIF